MNDWVEKQLCVKPPRERELSDDDESKVLHVVAATKLIYIQNAELDTSKP